MYSINLDYIRRILFIEFRGHLSAEEIEAYYNELSEIIAKFNPKELSLLILSQKLSPIAPELADQFTKTMKLGMSQANKIAVVHGNRAAAKVQMIGFEEELRSKNHYDAEVMRFVNYQEAYDYLTNP